MLYGDTADGDWYFDLLRKRTDITEFRETLIFGQAYAGGAPLDPMAAVAALPDDAEICGCNGVCKGQITKAIIDQGPDRPRRRSGTYQGVGFLRDLHRPGREAPRIALGDAYQPSAVQPMCGCTNLGHDEVRRLIIAKSLKSIPAVMQELHWKTPAAAPNAGRR